MQQQQQQQHEPVGAGDEDPFDGIRASIEQTLGDISQSQARLFAGCADVLPQLQASLSQADEALCALEAAVARSLAAPASFRLTAATAFGRQVEVEALRFTFNDLQRTCAQAETRSSSQPGAVELSTLKLPGPGSGDARQWQQRRAARHASAAGGSNTSSSKAGGDSLARPPAGPPIKHSKLAQQQPQHGASCSGRKRPALSSAAAAAAAAADVADDTQGWGDSGLPFSYEAAIQEQREQQDSALDHISLHVDRIKETGQLMHMELEEQAGLLSGVEEDLDTTHMRLRGVRKKVASVLRQSRQDRQLCLIIALSCVLVILTVLALL